MPLVSSLHAQEFTGGSLFIASGGSDEVLVFDEQQDPAGALVSGGTPGQPSALAFGPDGLLYVTSLETGDVAVFTGAGVHITTIGVGGPGSQPVALAFGPDGLLHVLDAATSRLYVRNVAGADLGFVDLPPGDYARSGLLFGADGHVFLSDGAGDGNGPRVLELDLGGALVRALGTGLLTTPAGLAFGPGGLLHVADGSTVVQLDANGELAGTITGPALDEAGALVFGPDGHLFVSASMGDEVVEFNAAGAQLKAFGTAAGLSLPGGLAFAPWRFKTSIKGTLARPGLPLQSVKEPNAVIALQPGARTLMLALTDDVSNGADLASVFSTSFLLFHGFEAGEDDGAGSRLFHGAQVAAPAQHDGVASLVLRVKGSIKAGQFHVGGATGVIHRAGATGVYTATLKTGSALK